MTESDWRTSTDPRVMLDNDPADGFGLRELGPEHPEYGRYRAFAEPAEDPRQREERTP
jgi:hypothetical protein